MSAEKSAPTGDYQKPLPDMRPEGDHFWAGTKEHKLLLPTGPDGTALDDEGNLVIVHAGFGTVWVFSRLGEPLYRIKSCAGMRTTNVAYGGPDRRTLYITEAEHGVILKAQLPVPGKLMYSHT